MEETINSIKERAATLEGFGDVLENLYKNLRYYQHEDEETGEVVDDNDMWSKGRAQAYRSAIEAVKKLAGVK